MTILLMCMALTGGAYSDSCRSAGEDGHYHNDPNSYDGRCPNT